MYVLDFLHVSFFSYTGTKCLLLCMTLVTFITKFYDDIQPMYPFGIALSYITAIYSVYSRDVSGLQSLEHQSILFNQ